jgi:hypothetical protein
MGRKGRANSEWQPSQCSCRGFYFSKQRRKEFSRVHGCKHLRWYFLSAFKLLWCGFSGKALSWVTIAFKCGLMDDAERLMMALWFLSNTRWWWWSWCLDNTCEAFIAMTFRLTRSFYGDVLSADRDLSWQQNSRTMSFRLIRSFCDNELSWRWSCLYR